MKPSKASGPGSFQRASRIPQFSPALVACLLGSGIAPVAVAADPERVDNRFEEYYTAPCLLGGPTLIAAPYNWSVQQVIDYNVICAAVFSGTFTGADNYSSSSAIGSVAAQSRSSESVAQQQVDSVMDRLDDLQEEEAPRGGWGLLLSAQKGETEREASDNELGFGAELDGVMVGLDYRFNDAMVTGVALGATTDNADYDDNGGDLETESRSLMIYTTWVVGDSAFVDAYVGTASLDFDNRRNFTIDGEPGDDFGVSGTITAKFEGSQVLAGVSGGYDWYFGDYTLGLHGLLDHSETEVDAYQESGATNFELAYPKQKSKSTTLTLGVSGSVAIDLGWGLLAPNAGLDLVHQVEEDAREFEARLLLMPMNHPDSLLLETDAPDRDYALATLGAAILTNAGTQYFLTYEKMLEHDYLDSWSISAGVLLEF